MNYIVDLFRSRHFDAGLFAAPYDERQRAAIRPAGCPQDRCEPARCPGDGEWIACRSWTST